MSTGLFVEMMAQAVMGMLITPGCCNEVRTHPGREARDAMGARDARYARSCKKLQEHKKCKMCKKYTSSEPKCVFMNRFTQLVHVPCAVVLFGGNAVYTIQ